MKKILINTNDSHDAVSYLHRLLKAADKAQEEGKYLALGKVLKEARRLSEKIKETQSNPFRGPNAYDHKKAIAELQWLKYQSTERSSGVNSHHQYKKVIGEIID